jgi:3-deoxy-D-manno-octulosonic-acid transferase
MFNFAEITAQLLAENGITQVNHMADLAPELSRLLPDENARATLAKNAHTWLASKPPVAHVLADKLLALGGLA